MTEPEAQALRELPKGTVARLLATAQAPAPEGGTGLFELPQEAQARKDLFQLLGLGLRRILLLGEEGAGKSALLQRLSEEGRGRLLTGATVTAHPPDDTLLLIDHLETLDAQGWNRLGLALERHPGQVVLCLRGGASAPATWLLTEDAKVAVPSTPALREATSGRLPVEVAEQVDGVVELSRPDEQALGQLARHLLAGRGFPDDLVSELTPVLAEKAAASGRGAHELLALVRRVPQGAWRMDASAPGPAKKKPGRKGKKKASP